MGLTTERRLEVLRDMLLVVEEQNFSDEFKALSDAIKALEENARLVAWANAHKAGETVPRTDYLAMARDRDARKISAESLQERVEALEAFVREVATGQPEQLMSELEAKADRLLHPHASHCNDSEHEGACESVGDSDDMGCAGNPYGSDR